MIILAVTVLAAPFAAPTQAYANSKYAGIVIDARTGKTLYSYNADSRRYPA
ncbi:MAG: D-alanyl-D-alanine carboxypeptidase, partial [Pseudomonadota bacterium]